MRPEDVRFYTQAERYQTLVPYKVELGPETVKPNPECLKRIVRYFGVNPREAVYVGDSLYKDVYMAQQCGVWDVLAEYGRHYDPRHYNQLVEITHWTEEDVARELGPKKRKILPTFKILRFADLQDVIVEIEGRAVAKGSDCDR